MQELAIREMNNTDHEGRTITVEKVFEKKEENKEEVKEEVKEEKKEQKEQKIDASKTQSKTKIIVQNLHYKIRDEALKRMFDKYKPKNANVNVEKLKNGKILRALNCLIMFKNLLLMIKH